MTTSHDLSVGEAEDMAETSSDSLGEFEALILFQIRKRSNVSGLLKLYDEAMRYSKEAVKASDKCESAAEDDDAAAVALHLGEARLARAGVLTALASAYCLLETGITQEVE
jgi:hypothetical protein